MEPEWWVKGFRWYEPSESGRMAQSSAKNRRLPTMNFMLKFKYWIPVVIMMACIYWMSTDALSSRSTMHIIEPILRFFAPSLSRKEILMIHGTIRKAAHVIVYLILGLLLFRAFRAGSNERRLYRWAGSSLVVVVLYAMTDEFHQLHVPMRTASLIDVGFDTLGGILAQCISVIYYDRRGRQEKADSFNADKA
jgi:VanZ family protein